MIAQAFPEGPMTPLEDALWQRPGQFKFPPIGLKHSNLYAGADFIKYSAAFFTFALF